MKNHAFVRSNVPVILNGKLKTEKDNDKENNSKIESGVPSFGTYVYFLFAPTLVYRNVYPR